MLTVKDLMQIQEALDQSALDYPIVDEVIGIILRVYIEQIKERKQEYDS